MSAYIKLINLFPEIKETIQNVRLNVFLSCPPPSCVLCRCIYKKKKDFR